MTAVMKMLLELHNINMKNLQSLRLQMILLQLKQNAFQYCKSLKFIDIPLSVKRIGGDAFEYCESLKFVNISEGCVEIGMAHLNTVVLLKT